MGKTQEFFADRLRYLIAIRRLPQVKLAQEIGTSQTNVSRWLGGTVPEVKFASALAKRLHVKIEWLIEGEGSKPSRLEGFLHEIRSHEIPALDRRILQILKGKDAGTDVMKTLVKSLQDTKARYERMAEFAEKHGEAGLEAQYLEEAQVLDRSRKSGRKSADEYKLMLSRVIGVSPDLSDIQLEAAFEAFMKRSQQIGPVRAAAENLRKKRN